MTHRTETCPSRRQTTWETSTQVGYQLHSWKGCFTKEQAVEKLGNNEIKHYFPNEIWKNNLQIRSMCEEKKLNEH